MVIRSTNPATNETFKEYPEMSLADINNIIEKSHDAFLNVTITLKMLRRFCNRMFIG